MKKLVLIAALVAAAATQPAWAAKKAATPKCTPASAAEAQHALRFMTELGIATNACSSIGIYADFRVRNRDAIVGYQKTMIQHLRSNAAFDKWNTSLANELAQRQSAMVPVQFCQQAMALLEQAKTLDTAKYRAYAAAQAASDTRIVKCSK